MKPSQIILVLVLVAVVFFGTIFLFIFKSFSGPSARPNPSVPAPATTTLPVGTTTVTTSDQTPADSDSHSALNDCVQLKAYEAGNKEYERGSLLVSFYPAVSYSLAVDSIELLGLRVQESDSSRTTFNQNHWLTVIVPSGEEFEWQCQLDASEGVKKANLNLTFKLRQ